MSLSKFHTKNHDWPPSQMVSLYPGGIETYSRIRSDALIPSEELVTNMKQKRPSRTMT